MPKKIFFGIWEFIFLLIIIVLIVLFLWPAISGYIKENKQKKYDETIEKIIVASNKYVKQRPDIFVEEKKTYKITLDELAGSKLISLPVKNVLTGKEFNPKTVYIYIVKLGDKYEYQLQIDADYKNAKLLSSLDVKVGDYVDYPVSYVTDNIVGVQLASMEGWRVLFKNGNTIKIISAGQPSSYDSRNPDETYKALVKKANYKCDKITAVASEESPCMGNVLNSKYVLDEVEMLNNEEVFKIALSSSLRTTGNMYYITTEDENKIMAVDFEGKLINYMPGIMGVRPILTLRTDVKTIGKINDTWQLIVK